MALIFLLQHLTPSLILSLYDSFSCLNTSGEEDLIIRLLSLSSEILF